MDASGSFSTTSSVGSSVGSFFGKENCHVCKRPPSDTVKIHACKFCGKTVCHDHSMRRRDLSEQVPRARICDKCHKDIIGAGVKGERKAEVKCLRRQLDDFNRNVERRTLELAAKQEKLAEKRSDLSALQQTSAEQQQSLRANVTDVEAQLAALRTTLSRLKDVVRVSQLSVKSLREVTCEKRALLETTSREIATITAQLPEYEKAVERTTEKLRKCVSKVEAARLLCPKCNPNYSRMMISSAIAKNRSMSRGADPTACKKCEVM